MRAWFTHLIPEDDPAVGPGLQGVWTLPDSGAVFQSPLGPEVAVNPAVLPLCVCPGGNWLLATRQVLLKQCEQEIDLNPRKVELLVERTDPSVPHSSFPSEAVGGPLLLLGHCTVARSPEG